LSDEGGGRPPPGGGPARLVRPVTRRPSPHRTVR